LLLLTKNTIGLVCNISVRRKQRRFFDESYAGVVSRPVRPTPRSFSGDWPNEVCSDPVAEVARLLALKLRTLTDKHGVREIARRAGVSSSIISRTINGESWVDTATLARLEVELGVDLWPRRSRTTRRTRI
jgi:hypothetical protein